MLDLKHCNNEGGILLAYLPISKIDIGNHMSCYGYAFITHMVEYGRAPYET